MSQASVLKAALDPLRDRPEELIEVILRQAGVIEQLQKELAELKQQIKDINDRNDGLSAKVEALEKKAARQAAPFRIDEKHRVLERKRPGRAQGHPGVFRAVPDHVDEEIVVPLGACPHCQGRVGPRRPVVQYIEELPVVRPHVTKLVTEEAECPHCQTQVRSTHPLQVSLAEGAAAVQLGPRALGLATQLSKQHGLTMRKTCAVLREAFGLRLSPGGLSQALARMAAKLEPAYENLLVRLRAGPCLHSDETSWWVGGPGYWLWVLTNKTMTIYRVAKGRGRDLLLEMLGPEYAGVLVSDCLATYDDVNPRQQKCYSHHLKAIRVAGEDHPSAWLDKVRWLLQEAMALKGQTLAAADRAQRRAALEDRGRELLAAPRPTTQEEKVRRRLEKQQDHLFTFLDVEEVEATNNLAERQLRPAVIARKVSCGNKTLQGAHTWEILTSLAATCTQQAASFVQLVGQAALLSATR
jgi:transposase